MILTPCAASGKSVNETVKRMAAKLAAPVAWLGKYYSKVLEKEVSTRQTWLLLEAQAAFFAGIFPMDYNLIVRLLMLLWFVNAAKRCRKSGL